MSEESNDIVVYQSNDGEVSFNVSVFEEDIWLTQGQMAELFDKTQPTISEHISNIFYEGELDKDSVHRKFRYTASDGKSYITSHYSLDVVISVGYRVKSHRGTQFRRWANKVLKQYMLNGYTVNTQRLDAIEKAIVDMSKDIREGFKELHKSLIDIANRPIQVMVTQQLASLKLEDKLIELLDELITDIKKDKVLEKTLSDVKSDIRVANKDVKARVRVIQFFTDMGDKDSRLSKMLKGAGATKTILVKIVAFSKKVIEYFQ